MKKFKVSVFLLNFIFATLSLQAMDSQYNIDDEDAELVEIFQRVIVSPGSSSPGSCPSRNELSGVSKTLAYLATLEELKNEQEEVWKAITWKAIKRDRYIPRVRTRPIGDGDAGPKKLRLDEESGFYGTEKE